MTPRSAMAATIAASVLALAATGAVAASSSPLPGAPDKTAPPTGVESAPPGVATTVPAPTTVPTATTAIPSSTVAVVGNGPPIGTVVNIGDAKPLRFYDPYLAAALADLQTWWATEYPRLFGEPYTPLAGGIFAAYPERTDPIPGCGFPGNTSYQEVSDYGAFYCPDGDYMAYDDGDQGIVFQLAETYSPSVVAVVMAHEFGHAIQARTGHFHTETATIYAEQQADCVSGAWARRVWDGQVPGLAFGDEDIRTGLVALVTVADPIGPNELEPGRHGSAFDRIGAFQEGFSFGVDKCANLVHNPLPLLPNEFVSDEQAVSDGDAGFGWEPGQIIALLRDDLAVYWPDQVAAAGGVMPTVSLRAVADPLADNCGDPDGMAHYGAVHCAATNEVLFDEALGRVLYDDFGDFAVGYIVGLAWADAVQTALGSQLLGEQRALASDCLVGAWIAAAIPNFDSGISPTSTAPAVRAIEISPGDLDEAVRTALVVGDRGLSDDLEGSAFEKIASMRRGVLNGLPTCLAQITG